MPSASTFVTVLPLSLVVLFGCTKDDRDEGAPPASASGPSSPPAPAPPPPPPAPSPLELLLAKPTLADAIAHVRPHMTDTNDETSEGAILLALWGMKHFTWADVSVAKNETSMKLVQKDADAHRGKRLCIGGRIIQIAKEKVGEDDAVFNGLLLAGYSDIYSFIAIGSTGELVQNSRARFCGVAIGTYDYSNSGGGKGHAISLVGMFDLPENRAR